MRPRDQTNRIDIKEEILKYAKEDETKWKNQLMLTDLRDIWEQKKIILSNNIFDEIAKNLKKKDMEMYNFAEIFTSFIFVKEDYNVIYKHNFLCYDEKSKEIVAKIIGDDNTNFLVKTLSFLFRREGKEFKGQPDLFVYKHDNSDYSFVEVKRMGEGSDRLQISQKVFISYLKLMGIKFKLIRLVREDKKYNSKEFSWQYPWVRE